MAVLTAPTANGPLIHALRRTVDAQGPVAEATLARRSCPPVARGQWPPAMWVESLDLAVAVGVLSRDGEALQAGPAPAASEDRIMDLRTWFLDDRLVTSDVFKDGTHGTNDLVRGLCWLLTTDPFGPPVTFAVAEQVQNQQRLPAAAVKTQEQFRALARWAGWMAVGTPTGDAGYATVASLRHDVDAALAGKDGDVSLADLIAAVAMRNPLADDGRLRRDYTVAARQQDSDNVISPVLSQALVSLMHRRRVRLHAPKDAAIAGVTELRVHGWDRPVSRLEVLT